MLKDLVRNKTTDFGKVLSRDEFESVIAQNKVSLIEDEEPITIESGIVTEEEISDYIVENPKEVVVEFPIISDVKLDKKLPFFRSICFKLGGI